jgi:hypothetical protein
MTTLVRPLFDGPIDVVGDVHGEIDALHDLLRHPGYIRHGDHPEGRRLVFLGDLTDRGPDRPSVEAQGPNGLYPILKTRTGRRLSSRSTATCPR